MTVGYLLCGGLYRLRWLKVLLTFRLIGYFCVHLLQNVSWMVADEQRGLVYRRDSKCVPVLSAGEREEESSGPSSEASCVSVFSSYFTYLYFLLILPLKPKAAHRTVRSKFVKFGILLEGHFKRPWREIDTDWPKGGAIANSRKC